MMKDELTNTCKQHQNRFECPDTLITFSEKNNEYGLIIHDGGSSSVTIKFCPWCGALLKSIKDCNDEHSDDK